MWKFLKSLFPSTGRRPHRVPRCRPDLEPLELRANPVIPPPNIPSNWFAYASYDYSTRTVTVTGSIFDDSIRTDVANPGTGMGERLVVTIADAEALNVPMWRIETFPGYQRTVPNVTSIQFSGDTGNDRFENYTGVTATLRGGPGDDTLEGGTGTDYLYGDAGADSLYGHTYIYFNGQWTPMSSGNDYIYGGSEADHVYAGDGNDYVYGEGGDDWLYGDTGNDVVYGGDNNDHVYGVDGADWLYGDAGNDYLYGWTGNDYVYGGAGNDVAYGDAGNDSLAGEDGSDWLFGGNDSDWLWGGAGYDYLYGEAGDDPMIDAGGAGETADGGAGWDFNPYIVVVGGTQMQDVRQNGMPTCEFLSCLASVALHNTIDLQSGITYLGNSYYSVRLWRQSGGTMYLSYETVLFNGTTVLSDPEMPAENESWPLLYQRAFLQRMGVNWSYQDPTWDQLNYRQPADCFRALTARTSESYAAPYSDQLFTTIGTALLQNRNVQATSSQWQSPLAPGVPMYHPYLIDNHGYTVTAAYVGSNGQKYVEVRNPWGIDGGAQSCGDPNDGVVLLTWDEFKWTMYNGVTIC